VLLFRYLCLIEDSREQLKSSVKYGNPPNVSPKLGCLFGNPLSGGPKFLQTHDCPGGSRVSQVTVRIRVSIRIRVSLVLVIRWTNETKRNPNPDTNPNRNPTNLTYPTKPYHMTVRNEYMPLISMYAPTLAIP